MPSVDPADRTNDADSAQVGSSPTNSTMQAPRAVSAELRRSVTSARSPVEERRRTGPGTTPQAQHTQDLGDEERDDGEVGARHCDEMGQTHRLELLVSACLLDSRTPPAKQGLQQRGALAAIAVDKVDGLLAQGGKRGRLVRRIGRHRRDDERADEPRIPEILLRRVPGGLEGSRYREARPPEHSLALVGQQQTSRYDPPLAVDDARLGPEPEVSCLRISCQGAFPGPFAAHQGLSRRRKSRGAHR